MDAYDRYPSNTNTNEKRRQTGAMATLANAITAVSGQPTVSSNQKIRSESAVASSPITSTKYTPLDSDSNIHKWTQKQKQLIRERTLDINDPEFYLPLGMSVFGQTLWLQALMEGWMTKHMPPASAFTKTRKRRYVIVVDRMIYTFKKDKPATDFREFFELTRRTSIFATDQFPGVLYCLEIQRDEDGRTWYLQADNVEEMKAWLDVLKKTVGYLRLQRPGVVSRALLEKYTNEMDQVHSHRKESSDSTSQQSFQSDQSLNRAMLGSSRSTPILQTDLPSPTSPSAVMSAPTSPLGQRFKQQLPDVTEYEQPMWYTVSPIHQHPHERPVHAINTQGSVTNRRISNVPRQRPVLRLPDRLPPQLPPPTTSLPPIPPMT